ncbi:hypothetical protein QUA81_32870 [Microcoleus sp. F6_B4]
MPMLRKSLAGLGALIVLGSSTISATAAQFPVVQSAALGTSRSLPWSKPVTVTDPFEGTFVAVFDRNFFYKEIFNTNARVEVQSLWSRQSIRFLLTASDRDCLRGLSYFDRLSGSTCSEVIGSKNIIELFVKIGEQVFRVSGQNSTFVVSDELARALQNAPDGNASIRLVTESGSTVDSEIGKETVKAWRTVYTNPVSFRSTN